MGVKMQQTTLTIKRGLKASTIIAGYMLGYMIIAAGAGYAALVATIEIQTRWGNHLIWPL